MRWGEAYADSAEGGEGALSLFHALLGGRPQAAPVQCLPRMKLCLLGRAPSLGQDVAALLDQTVVDRRMLGYLSSVHST